MEVGICRVCERSENLEQIFQQENSDIAEKLMICANVKVELEDDLPKYICFTCHESLDHIYQFKIQCEKTDRKLREQASSQNGFLIKDETNMVVRDLYENCEDCSILVEPNEVEEYLLEEYEDVEELIEEVDDAVLENDIENEKRTQLSVYSEEVEFNNEATNFIKKENIVIENHELDEMEKSNDNIVKEEEYQDYEHYSDDEEKYVIEETLSIESQQFQIDSELDYITYSKECEEQQQQNKRKRKMKTKTKNSDNSFCCDTCGETFGTFLDFNLHKKSHGDRRYQCPQCMKWFSKRYRLKNHMSIHEESKSFCCEICGNKYTNQGNLDRHIRHFHKKERPYMCTECGLSFARSNILKLHYTVHMSERNYECDVCHKRFKAQYYLNLHKKSHIPIEERQLKVRKRKNSTNQQPSLITCPYCQKISASKALHISHLRIHTGEKPFECQTCLRKFAFRQSLKSHELLHTGEKPYSCDLCGLSFRQIGHLKGHKLVHSGIKQHKCAYCEKSFSLKSNLVVHQRLHTGETPYHCNLCNKKFYDSNGLKRHKHSHLRKKKDQQVVDVVNVGTVEQLNTYFEEEHKEYKDIIEIQTGVELKVVNLNNANVDPC